MTDQNYKKQDKGNGGVNPVIAAVTGAIVGAGVAAAVAGTVALKDEKNRERVKEILTNAKDKAIGYVEDMQKQAQDKKVEVEGKLAEDKEKVKKLVN